jgi:bacillithiol biosynthesis cysteine-adding enzyme BshC
MFIKKPLSLSHTGTLNNLVSDYISGKQDIKDLYEFKPELNGYKNKLSDEKLYVNLNRPLLSACLLKQAKLVANTSTLSLQNIELLKQHTCFTVTTGHQLCLFTGPLYFIHKILSTINLSEWLRNQFPEKQFVPVYWMASEDHDFEEINHAHVFGKKIEWRSAQTGAVGNFKTAELSDAINELSAILGESTHATELIDLFKKAYLEHANLSLATRFLVNELFGKFGLVVLDGNDKELKQEFRPVFHKDIFENTSFKKVNDTIAVLNSKNYPTQVNPREINCFYMNDATRARIEKQNDRFVVLNTPVSFSRTEMEDLIEKETDKISPNVVLRPLYQQSILPNIAYVGGPGELSYWLQYKSMFDAYQIDFPILQPRNFVLIVDKIQQQKLVKLQIEIDSIFRSEKEITDQYLSQKGSTISLDAEKSNLESFFNDLLSKSIAIDKTLEGAVKAEQQKALNSVQAIEAKLNKALKQKSDTEINQIRSVKSKLFPENIPQERYDNLSMYYSKYGKEFIDALKEQLKDVDLNYNLLLEI